MKIVATVLARCCAVAILYLKDSTTVQFLMNDHRLDYALYYRVIFFGGEG